MQNVRSASRRLQIPLDLIVLDRENGDALYRQLYVILRDLIMSGVLPFNLRLPSSRALSEDLGISRNTVVSTYEQLEIEGFVEARRGSQTYVAAAPKTLPGEASGHCAVPTDPLSARGRQMVEETLDYAGMAHRRSMQPGIPDVRYFPFNTWRRILTRRLQAGGDDVFGYHYRSGYPPLQRVIARYLATARGVRCEPEQIIITNGAQSAFDLFARILTDPGDTVWVEEPGYPAAQSAFKAAGASIKPLLVTTDGWDLSNPPEGRIRVIYVTPSCQSPLGVTMRLEERLQLTEIAKRHGAWIIEDDFDGEYRFAGRPVPALQGITPDSRTIYVGTFSKTVFPALRIGFTILPENMVANLSQAIFVSGQYPSTLLQAALADFMVEGHFTTHLGRMRRLYGKRREQFEALCEKYLGEWLYPANAESGIQSLWYFRGYFNDVDIVRRCRDVGVVMTPLSIHYGHALARHGLIFGYTALEPEAMKAELMALRAVLVDRSGIAAPDSPRAPTPRKVKS
jgi:GntR family transcriptional regulator / MocR family aminotransferase